LISSNCRLSQCLFHTRDFCTVVNNDTKTKTYLEISRLFALFFSLSVMFLFNVSLYPCCTSVSEDCKTTTKDTVGCMLKLVVDGESAVIKEVSLFVFVDGVGVSCISDVCIEGGGERSWIDESCNSRDADGVGVSCTGDVCIEGGGGERLMYIWTDESCNSRGVVIRDGGEGCEDIKEV